MVQATAEPPLQTVMGQVVRGESRALCGLGRAQLTPGPLPRLTPPRPHTGSGTRWTGVSGNRTQPGLPSSHQWLSPPSPSGPLSFRQSHLPWPGKVKLRMVLSSAATESAHLLIQERPLMLVHFQRPGIGPFRPRAGLPVGRTAACRASQRGSPFLPPAFLPEVF